MESRHFVRMLFGSGRCWRCCSRSGRSCRSRRRRWRSGWRSSLLC